MPAIRITFDGGQWCTATHGASGATLTSHGAADANGSAQSFSPADLLAAAVGTCVLVTVANAARHRGIDLTGAEARVAASIVSRPTRRVERLEVLIAIARELSDDQRAALEWAAQSSPVRRSIHQDVELIIAFAWGDAAVAPSPAAQD